MRAVSSDARLFTSSQHHWRGTRDIITPELSHLRRTFLNIALFFFPQLSCLADYL